MNLNTKYDIRRLIQVSDVISNKTQISEFKLAFWKSPFTAIRSSLRNTVHVSNMLLRATIVKERKRFFIVSHCVHKILIGSSWFGV